MWLCNMNFNLFTNEEIKKINQLLYNISCDKNMFEEVEYSLYFYYYESLLRDEIYNIGYFNTIKILEKEKPYSFGRIDLYGNDINGDKVCIELKKNNNFSNTKEQLLKYQKSGCFDKIIYCALNIDKDFLEWLKQNNIIPYVYKRQLILSEVC